ncbi:MAG: lipase family protein [Chloroflexaceae bacterium]|nr:lipase family protein [Chloroflexaceae bacterium]
MGGALAVLFAAMLAQDKIPITGLYTFGAPRVGNKRFAEAFDRNLKTKAYRVVNEGDLVPHLPPPLGFTTQELLFYTKRWETLKLMMFESGKSSLAKSGPGSPM